MIGERWSPKLDGMLRVRLETQGAATNETYATDETYVAAAAPLPTRELHLTSH